MIPPQSLSSQDLAKLLDIHVSTVKRLADSGQLPCIKTPGGHRRFRLEDVRSFLAEQGICPKSLEPLIEMAENGESHDIVEQAILARRWPWLREHLIALAGAGQTRRTGRLFLAAHLAGIHPSELCDHLIAPAMHLVGHQWAANQITVADEHLISHVVASALAEMPIDRTEERKLQYRALCGCLSPDLHELGCQCVLRTLTFEGWHVVMLGAATPVESFVAAIEKHTPDLVCLSATVIYDAVAFTSDCERLANAAQSLGSKFVVGGDAVFSLNITCPNGAAVLIQDMGGLVEYVRENFYGRASAADQIRP